MTLVEFLSRLDTCQIEGTSYSDRGVKVSVRPDEGETVQFFVIDDNLNSDCTIRQDLAISGPICDILIFYAFATRELICLVELKGRNVSHAIEQVINTVRNLRPYVNTNWRAYIRTGISGPVRIKPRDKKRLEREFGKGQYRIRRKADVGSFLRNT